MLKWEGKKNPSFRYWSFYTDDDDGSGFAEASRGCCGTGTVETTSLLCNQNSLGTCSNATQYVFWDSVHPSEAANQVLADALIIEGINLIGWSYIVCAPALGSTPIMSCNHHGFHTNLIYCSTCCVVRASTISWKWIRHPWIQDFICIFGFILQAVWYYMKLFRL